MRASYQNKMHSTRSRRRDESHQVELEVFLFLSQSELFNQLRSAAFNQGPVAGRRAQADILTDGHLHSVCAGSGGGGGYPHGAADGGGRGSRGGGRGGSSPNVLTPSQPPLAGKSAWALAAAVVAGRAGLGTALVALLETVRRRGGAGGGGEWSFMRRQRRARCGQWSRRRRP